VNVLVIGVVLFKISLLIYL